jgi:hypothetical protein
MNEQRIREIVRSELEKVREEVAASISTSALCFKPFKAPGDTKPAGMVRKRGLAGYFPSENA